jgi:hypothetical protein
MNRLLFSTSLAVAAIAAGCGGSGGDPDADPAAVVPSRAPVYVEATINPDGETADEIKALSQKLAGTDKPGAELKKLFDKAVNEDEGGSFSWDKDVKPWIGDRVGVYVTSVNASGEDADAALVAPTDDPDKAQEFLEKDLAERDASDEQEPKVTSRTYKDTKYKVDTANDLAVAILGDYAVTGTEKAVKGGIDGHEGDNLADTDAFKKARDQVQDEGVAFGYVKLSTLFSALGPQGAAARQAFGQMGDTVAFALDTDKDAIRMETAALGAKSNGASGDPGKLIAELPADSWLAAGTADIGTQLEQALQQIGQLGALGGTDIESVLGQLERQFDIDLRDDVISWMGDGGVFVRGESLGDIGGALVVQSKDADKTEAFIGKLRRLASQIPGANVRSLSESGVDAGLTFRSSQLPLPVHVAAAGDKFIVAVTDGALQAALKPSGALGEDAEFKAAAGKLEDGIKPSFFLDFAPVRSLVDGTGAVQGADAQKARQALDHLTTVAAGGKRDGDVQRGRVVVGVK